MLEPIKNGTAPSEGGVAMRTGHSHPHSQVANAQFTAAVHRAGTCQSMLARLLLKDGPAGLIRKGRICLVLEPGHELPGIVIAHAPFEGNHSTSGRVLQCGGQQRHLDGCWGHGKMNLGRHVFDRSSARHGRKEGERVAGLQGMLPAGKLIVHRHPQLSGGHA